MATEKVSIKIEADLSPLKQGLKEAGNVVDQEKMRLRSKTALQMSINLGLLRTQLREVNDAIKRSVAEGNKTAEIKFRADAEILKKEITKANRELLNFTRTGDKTKSVLGNLFDGIGSSLKNIGPLIATTFSVTALAGFAKSVFNLTSQTQQLKNSFETLTGSEATALSLLKQIDDFAKQTPFNKLQVAENAQKLLAYGFEANKVVNVLQAVGNAVSAVGGTDETLSGVIVALGQMQTKGKLVQQEVNQIAERGIPIFQILKEELGLTEAQLGDIGNQAIKASVAVPAILAGFQKRYLESLDKQSQTLQGRFSNIVDSLQLALGNFGANSTQLFYSILDGVSNFISGSLPAILGFVSQSVTAVSSLFTSIVDGLGMFTTMTSQYISNFINDTTETTSDGVQKQAGIMKTVILGIASVLTFLNSAIMYSIQLFKVGVAFAGDMGNIFIAVLGNMGKLLTNFLYNVDAGFSNIPVFLTKALNTTLKVASEQLNKLGQLFNKITLSNLIPKIEAPQLSVGASKPYRELTSNMQKVNLTFSNTTDQIKLNTAEASAFYTKTIDNLALLTEKSGKTISKSFDTKTLDGLGKSINQAKKELGGLNVGSKEYLDKQKLISDLNKKLTDQFSSLNKAPKGGSADKGSGGGQSKEEAKKELELNKKALEDIKRINDDKVLSAEEKANKVLEIDKKLQDDLDKINSGGYKTEIDNANRVLKSLEEVKNKESKLYDKRKKNAEDYLKLQEDAYKVTNDIIEKEIEQSKKTIAELEKKIESVKEKINDLNKSNIDLVKEKDADLSDRYLDNLKEQADIQQNIKDIVKEEETGANYDEYIALEQKKQLETEKLNKLIAEQVLLKGNLTAEQIAEAQRADALNPTEKLIEKYNTQKAENDLKLVGYAKDLLDLETQKINEEAILKTFNDNKIQLDLNYKENKDKIEKEITASLKTEINLRETYLEGLRLKALETARAMRSVSSGSGGSNTVNNNANTNIGNVNIQSGVDVQSLNRIITPNY